MKIAGFRDEIDAEGGALVYSFLIKKIVQNIHDEDLLDLAIQKSKAKANPLAARKIFFVHGYSGGLVDGSYEWERLKEKLDDIYPIGIYEYIDYSYCARGFDDSHSGIDDLSTDFKTFILDNTQPGDIIDVVGHSMGGIIIRDMVRRYRATLNSYGVTIEKGIIIAGANDGTPWADVLHYYVTFGWAIWLILMIRFSFVWGTILFVAVDFVVQLIADGYNAPRFRFARVENSWFDNILNDPSTESQYSGTIWYGLRVYADPLNPIIIATALLCSFYGQSSKNDNILSVSSTKLPDFISNYIEIEEEHHYYYHGEAHTDPALVGKPASWLELTGDEIYYSSGTLSGSGDTDTFSKSSLSGTYTVVMAGNEEADFDLYAKWNSPPTTSSYDARSYTSYSLEYFTVSGSGTLYVMVHSYSGSGHWKANILIGRPSIISLLMLGTLSGSGDTDTYSLARSGRAWVYLAGPDSSDFDLYIKWNSQPTTSSYDCCGYSSWSQEICTYIGTGTLYYMVRSYRGSGQYVMVAMIF